MAAEEVVLTQTLTLLPSLPPLSPPRPPPLTFGRIFKCFDRPV